MCKNLQIEITALYEKSSYHKIAKKRALLINYLLQYADVNFTAAAKLFQKSQGTLSRQVKKLNSLPEKYFSDVVLNKIKVAIEKEMAKNLH